MDQEKERFEKMKILRDEVVALSDSPLYEYRTQNGNLPVIGEGSHMAKILFIGEAPGKNEAKTGRPFCGAAGKILDQLLASVNLERSKVYITNIVKDRPPENRDPEPEEIALYGPFLERQIDIIQPEVIVGLGRFSSAYIMGILGLSHELLPISKIHGKLFEGKTSYGAVKMVPLYHPAVAIYNQHEKETLFRDFNILTKFQ